MTKFVKFTAAMDLENNTLTMPDSLDMFSSLSLDAASGEVRAAYSGALPLDEIPRGEAMGWEADVEARRAFDTMRLILTKKEFHLAFDSTEYRAITNATGTDDTLYQLWNALNVADFVDLQAPETVNGMAYIVSQGLLTQERHDEILAGVPAN